MQPGRMFFLVMILCHGNIVPSSDRQTPAFPVDVSMFKINAMAAYFLQIIIYFPSH
jgi:hypothetical protein